MRQGLCFVVACMVLMYDPWRSASLSEVFERRALRVPQQDKHNGAHKEDEAECDQPAADSCFSFLLLVSLDPSVAVHRVSTIIGDV